MPFLNIEKERKTKDTETDILFLFYLAPDMKEDPPPKNKTGIKIKMVTSLDQILES